MQFIKVLVMNFVPSTFFFWRYIFDPAVEKNLTNEANFIINVVSVLFLLPR